MLSMSRGGGWVSGGQVIRGCHTAGRADISWHPSVLCTSCSNVKCFWISHHPRSAPSCITLQLGGSRGLAVGIFTGSPCAPNRSGGGMGGGGVGMGQGTWGEERTAYDSRFHPSLLQCYPEGSSLGRTEDRLFSSVFTLVGGSPGKQIT